MLLDGPVGSADWPKAEVVGPSDHRAVKPRYHLLLVQQGAILSGQVANLRADALNALLRRNRAKVGAPRLRRVAPPECVTQKSNSSSGSLLTRVLVSFTVNLSFDIMPRMVANASSDRPRQQITKSSA